MIKFITYFSIINLILLSVIFLYRERARKTGAWLLTSCSLILAYTQWVVLLFYTGEIKQYQYLAYTEGIVFYLFVPLFYLYILKLIGELPHLTLKHTVHLLPAVPGMLFYLVYMTGNPEMRMKSIESNYCGFLPDSLLNTTGILTQGLYIFLSFRKLELFRKTIRNNFSNFKQAEIQWIYFLLIIFSVLSASYLLFINILTDKKQVDIITLLALDCLFLVIFIKNQLYSFGIVPIVEGLKGATTSLNRSKEKLLDEDSKAIREKLLTYMENQKPYLDSSLNLAKLASALGVCAYTISLLLNATIKQTFFDFINMYRVEESKRLLDSLSKNQYTIEGIGFESGFNSKTAFYRAFKKNTGLTPTEYIKMEK